MDPQTKLGQRGTELATPTPGVDLAHYDPIFLYTHRNQIGCGGTILGTNVYNPVGKMITMKTTLHNLPVAPQRPTENRTVSLKSSTYNSSNLIPLDNTIVTPIQINFKPFFTSCFQKRENQSIPLSRMTTFHCSTQKLTTLLRL